jgi:hypothetical protein
MELKTYQQRVIDDLTAFLGYLEQHDSIPGAFRAYWDERGATGMENYKNNVPGAPHVCVKVPTAGGEDLHRRQCPETCPGCGEPRNIGPSPRRGLARPIPHHP